MLARERTAHGVPAVMAERVDVCIVGLRLRRLDLRLPARRALPRRRRGRRASSCSSAGSGTGTPTSSSRCTSSTSRDVYGLIQGPGRADRPRQRRRRQLEPLPGRVAALAAARPSSAATAAPTTAPTGACGRRADLRASAQPLLRARREQACASSARRGTRSRSPAACGRRRSTRAGHTCDRVPLAINLDRCVDAQVVPHGLHLRRQELGDHQLPGHAPRRSACRCGPNRRSSRSASPARARTATSSRRPDRRRAPSHRRGTVEFECKVLILAAGRDGQPAAADALAPALPPLSDQRRQAPRRQRRPRRGDRVRPAEGARRARAARLRRVLQGQPDHDDDLRLLDRPAAATAATAPASRSRRSSCRR